MHPNVPLIVLNKVSLRSESTWKQDEAAMNAMIEKDVLHQLFPDNITVLPADGPNAKPTET